MASASSLSLIYTTLVLIVSFLCHTGFSLQLNFSSIEERDGKVRIRVAAAAESSSELWCVAKNNAEDGSLQSGLDWVCGLGGADCGPIQQGGACFEPNDIQSHASYAFNDYFHKNTLDPQSCVFGNAAALTALNPSRGKCVFPSSFLARNGSFTGSATGTTTGIGPSADLSGSYYSACRWGWSLVTALVMFSAALIL